MANATGLNSVLALTWTCNRRDSQKYRHLGKTRIRVYLILKTEISHTARLISISAAHSLLQFKSANGGLHCLFSAAYTMHQICLLGTRYYLQEYVPQRYVCSHLLRNRQRPHSITLYLQLSAEVSYATSCLSNIKICHFFWDQCNHCRWWSVTNRKHPSFCCTSLKKPAANCSLLVSTAHFCVLRNARLYTAVSVPTADRMARKKSSYMATGSIQDDLLGNIYNRFLQRLRFTQNQKAPVFSYTDETSSSLMRKWSDVTLSSSWISSINAFCTTETSRELSATTAVPHSHCHVPENESLQFPYSCCRQRAKDYSPSSLVRQMVGIKCWNYLYKTLIRVTLFSATIRGQLLPALHSSCWLGLILQEIIFSSHHLQGTTEKCAIQSCRERQRE